MTAPLSWTGTKIVRTARTSGTAGSLSLAAKIFNNYEWMYVNAILNLLTIVRLLDLVKLFLPILPEVELPYEKVSLDEKVIFTISGAIIFLLGQLPIYGLKPTAYLSIHDPFASIRPIFAMERGTLLELGLLPVITAAFVWQLAAGLKLVKVNLGLRSERELFQTGQKLTSFALAIVFALGLFVSGYYDESLKSYTITAAASSNISQYILIFVQIFSFQVVVVLLVEIFDKGYGFGSGALGLLTVQVATNLIRDLVGFEVFTVAGSNREVTIGALMSLIKSFSFDVKAFGAAIWDSFTRTDSPNLTQAYISVVSLLVVVGIINFRIELPIRSTKVRGMNNVYPIRLLYTGALPLLFAITVLANVQVFGYFLAKSVEPFYPVVSKILGSWELSGSTLNLVSGVLFYLSAPTSLTSAALSPIRTAVFSVALIVLSTWFANNWALIAGSSPKDVSKQFKDQGISIVGKRDVSITKELVRIIPVASVSGAAILAVVAIAGEVLGGNGKGIAAVIGVASAFGVLEEFIMEAQQNGGNSQLLGALGQR